MADATSVQHEQSPTEIRIEFRNIEDVSPFIWIEDGIKMGINPIQHMTNSLDRQLWFFGPVTEWKENIDEKYIWMPRAFEKAEEGEELSLEGHFNNRSESLYPKLITSLNNSNFTMQTLNEKMSILKYGDAKIEMYRDGKYMYFKLSNPEHGEHVKKVLIHIWGPVITILLTVLFLKTEGKQLKSFTIVRGDVPMETLGMEPDNAEAYYEAKKNNPSLTLQEYARLQEEQKVTESHTQHSDEGPRPIS